MVQTLLSWLWVQNVAINCPVESIPILKELALDILPPGKISRLKIAVQSNELAGMGNRPKI